MKEVSQPGDPAKLATDKFSARAKRATLRKDPPQTYAKGGAVKGKGVTSKGMRPAKFC